MAKAAGAPGHRRAILFVMPSPRAMESHNRLSETNAIARDRYQYALGSAPPSEKARLGIQVGSNTIATSKPTAMAIMNSKNVWILTDDSNSLVSEGGTGIFSPINILLAGCW